MFIEKLLQKNFSNSIQENVVLKICLYQSIDCYGPDPGGHKVTVLIWPVSFSKGLSALDVWKVIRKKIKRAIFAIKTY